ncbi:MAG: ABC transporter permease [Anaerolineae bacterium]|nr:ABC transporter permease [Anaerolineae bacterium]
MISLSLRRNISAALAETWLRLLSVSRYPGELFIELIVPTVLASMPILLGQAAAGPDAAANFAARTGTTNYVAYLLIGSNVFTLVTRAFWDIAYWLRFEQEIGTLEAVCLTPTSRLTLASGVAIYSAIRGLLTSSLAYVVGCLIFWVNPFQGDVLLALAFIWVGLTPLYGLAFLFGALILKVKETNALIGLMQWLVSFLMGIFFPVAVLPPLVRAVALAFPPTWMVNGVRSALLGVGFFFETWYLDLAMLGVFLLFVPLFTREVFRRVEYGLRRNQGVGEF